MESVWWVFRQLFDKGLVYKGFKVRATRQSQPGIREIGDDRGWRIGWG